ncbi:MAG: hypothetical protein AAGA90_07955 [Actinomycetota bacterium]
MTTDQVLDLIRRGKIPIEDVLESVRELVEQTESSIEWVINFDLLPSLGVAGELTADTMLVGEQYAVTIETGIGWDGIHPMADVRVARSIVRHALETRGADPDLVDQVPVGTLTRAIYERENPHPKRPS